MVLQSYTIPFTDKEWENARAYLQDILKDVYDFDLEMDSTTVHRKIIRVNDQATKIYFLPDEISVLNPKEYIEILKEEEKDLPQLFEGKPFVCIQHLPFGLYVRVENPSSPKQMPDNQVRTSC